MNNTTDTVMSLLASLGFDTDGPAEIKIDTFDQWSSGDLTMPLRGTAMCSVLIEQ